MKEVYDGDRLPKALKYLAFFLVLVILAGLVIYAAKLDRGEVTAAGELWAADSEEPVGEVDDQYTIALTDSLPEGEYILYYEDKDGRIADYEDICTLWPGEMNDDLILQNAAPVDAEKIGVYDSAGKRVGYIPLPAAFIPETEDKLYSFGVLSDIHIGYETAEEDFKTALAYLTRTEKVAFISITGDLTAACTDEQLKGYKAIVDGYAGTTPVYAVTGNHDTEQYRGGNISNSIHLYTEQPMYYSFKQGEDVFIFLGNYNGYDEGRLFTRAQLQWLYETLEENRNRRCFLFEHIRPDTTSGNPHDLQSVDLWGGVEQDIFESLLAYYPNITFFHGHSHTSLDLQADVDNANYDASLGCHSIHVPALFGTRKLDQYGYRYDEIDACEGYVVDVYSRGIMIRGIDFNRRKYLPVATYFLDTAIQETKAGNYTDNRMTINCEIITPHWNYKTEVDTSDGRILYNEDFSTTELIPVEKGHVYYAHQYWNCPYYGEAFYYNAGKKLIGSAALWGEEAYSGPVCMEMPEDTAYFQMKQWTRSDEVNHTRDVFITRVPQ